MHTPARELRIVATYQTRAPNRLDDPWCATRPAPDVDSLVQSATEAQPAEAWTITGGEPTLRPDLPQLLTALRTADAPRLVLRTDGLALTRESTITRLVGAGLDGVRIPLCTGRADAQDWLMGLPGASRTLRKALDQCASAGLPVEAEVIIARPTMPYLSETVAFLKRSGVSTLRFRMLQQSGFAKASYITLGPRLGLLQPYLEDALRTALREEMQVSVEGIPQCVFTRHSELACATDSVQWAIVDGPETHPDFFSDHEGERCDGCPGTTECAGAPAGYGERFGWAELVSEGSRQQTPGQSQTVPLPTSEDPVTAPPARQGRHPSTRVSAAVQQALRSSLNGDPMAGRAALPDQPDTYCLHFEPTEGTRAVRQRLVQCAQHGANTLRIDGDSLAHPGVHPLLRECLRLSFSRVEVQGPADHLAHCSDAELFQLRGLSHFALVLHGATATVHDHATGRPGSFEASLAVGERIGRLTSAVVEILPAHDADDLREALSQAWAAGDLPPIAKPPPDAPRWTGLPPNNDAEASESR